MMNAKYFFSIFFLNEILYKPFHVLWEDQYGLCKTSVVEVVTKKILLVNFNRPGRVRFPSLLSFVNVAASLTLSVIGSY